ncbi:hypothetical protein CUMW_258260 [Citrus unshiu]|uniref:Bulb-type lectin domain-containing protein n=1 Tax=Citrus unshiu TaxID=55188 RepID=A0A2H5QSQ9_CITUN|nr:hypothetical protein CUMW_258260 [Citrus unshiu]
MSSSSALVSFFFLLTLISAVANAQVPANETFKFVNEGGLGEYFNEYNANYRMSGIYNDPFQLGFYNTTPNAFTLALRLGIKKQEPVFRWVWEANRGKPVRENAVFSLGTDGNLVLAEADGTVVWQSNTANKGVVGFGLFPNGNMVLRDSKGNFIWQIFDYPTDTLLVGQSLRVGRVTKLVSRLSVKENVDGPYRFVMEPRRLAFYYKSSNVPRPILYYTFPFSYAGLKNLTLKSSPETRHYKLTLDSSDGDSFIMDRPKYNSTISFLRLGIDGNLRVFTYSQEVDFLPEEERFTLFGKISRGNDGINWGNECQMPDRCGKLGLCEDEQCVACPTENGLIGWSKENCVPTQVNFCGTKDFHYYKLESVVHYMCTYNYFDGIGANISIEACGKRCSSDCRCVGYFYDTSFPTCWIAFDLKTLTKAPDSPIVGFIKVSNKEKS